MNALERSRIRFNGARFFASTLPRFCQKPFCKPSAAFCNGKSFVSKNSAAVRASSFFLLSTKNSISGLRRAAIWLSHAAPVLGIFRKAKSDAHSHASVPGMEHYGTQQCPAQTPRHMSWREHYLQAWATRIFGFHLMRKAFVRFSLALLAIIGLALMAGVIHPITALVSAVAVQAVMFTVAAPTRAFFISSLTPDQVKEFQEIMADLKQYSELLPRLKDLPNQVAHLRRLGLGSGGDPSAIVQPGQFVSEGCAKHLAAIAIMGAERKGKLEFLSGPNREALLQRSGEILGIEKKTALTSSDIPLPIAYSGEVVKLVSMYGAARKYGTVFPLGTGTTKLPRLKTDTAFGLIAASATVTEKSPQTEWVTFTAEKFGGLVRLPSELSEDSILGLGQFVADYIARNLAKVEDQVFFLNLDGSTYGAVKGLCGSTIDNTKVVQMASTKTKYSDATLAYVRSLRSVPDAAALGTSAYYMHPSFEQVLSGFNTAGDRPYNPNAQLSNPSSAQPFITGPTLDGFPIRWVDIMPAYSTSNNVSKVFMLFGDLRFQYLGVMGQIRIDTSVEAAFTTDEILIRGLERFTIGLMATGAVGGLQTAAS